MNELKEMRNYCKYKEEVLNRTLWITRSGKELWTCSKT
jgi:hypothetical protein